MTEWSKVAVLKTVVLYIVGSNPSLSDIIYDNIFINY